MDYLLNYLSVLPQYDRREVEQLIQENMELFEVKVITKEEFEALLQQLANPRQKVTVLESTGRQLDAEHFNRMHSNVALDLTRLYQSHLVVEKVLANYNRILKGTLDDIQREVDSLSIRIEELNLKAKSEDGLIIKTYGFEEKDKSLYMETDRSKHANLFLDRYGRTLPNAELNRSFHQRYLSLPVKEIENALHDANGVVTAKIELIESQYPTQVISDDNHPIAHAIDDSLETYWAQAIVTNQPAYSEMKK